MTRPNVMPRQTPTDRPTGKKKAATSRLSGDDRAVWSYVTADVAPMKGRTVEPMDPDVPPETPVRTDTGLRRVAPPAPAPRAETPGGREMDKRTRQRFERGDMAIDAQLDLHGYGQAAARERLHGFLAQAWAQAMRCVLVITGKGRQNEGVLKARLPEWVRETPVRHMVLDIAPAKAHGSAGAYYILLRRQRLS